MWKVGLGQHPFLVSVMCRFGLMFSPIPALQEEQEEEEEQQEQKQEQEEQKVKTPQRQRLNKPPHQVSHVLS